MSGFAASKVAKYATSIESITIAILLIGTGIIVQFNQGGDMKITIGEVAGLVNLVAYLPYFVSIVKGETKPSKTTWWIWSALEIMLSASYVMSGAENTIWLPIASFVGMVFTAALSLFYGKREWTMIDSICSIGSFLGVIAWTFSGSPVVALSCFLVVDLLAVIPTVSKSWKNPLEEDLFAWVITLASGAINLLALEVWNFSIATLPVYNLIVYAAVVFVLIFSRRK